MSYKEFNQYPACICLYTECPRIGKLTEKKNKNDTQYHLTRVVPENYAANNQGGGIYYTGGY